MTHDDQEAREAKAKRLRAEIEAAITVPVPLPAVPPVAESPRDFIQRKMREQQAAAKKPDSKSV